MVYRFKVTYEDHEDVFRYIEIKSTQSFLELHSSIQQAIGFDNSKPATFYMSDDYWRKSSQIATVNTSEENTKKEIAKKNTKSNEEDNTKKKTIADHIDNPHQRFVYIFDPEREWTFLIELLKIIPVDKNASYPQCIKSIGNSPKQYKLTTPPQTIEEEEPLLQSKTSSSDKEEPAIVLELDPLDEAVKGFIPLDEDGIEETDLDDSSEPEEADEDDMDDEVNDQDQEEMDSDN